MRSSLTQPFASGHGRVRDAWQESLLAAVRSLDPSSAVLKKSILPVGEKQFLISSAVEGAGRFSRISPRRWMWEESSESSCFLASEGRILGLRASSQESVRLPSIPHSLP